MSNYRMSAVTTVTGYMYSVVLCQLILRYHNCIKSGKVNENTSVSYLFEMGLETYTLKSNTVIQKAFTWQLTLRKAELCRGGFWI